VGQIDLKHNELIQKELHKLIRQTKLDNCAVTYSYEHLINMTKLARIVGDETYYHTVKDLKTQLREIQPSQIITDDPNSPRIFYNAPDSQDDPPPSSKVYYVIGGIVKEVIIDEFGAFSK
jgi:hypothetical protein